MPTASTYQTQVVLENEEGVVIPAHVHEPAAGVNDEGSVTPTNESKVVKVWVPMMEELVGPSACTIEDRSGHVASTTHSRAGF